MKTKQARGAGFHNPCGFVTDKHIHTHTHRTTHLYYIKEYFLSVCMLSSRHGFVFQVRDVWFSLKGFKFSLLGVSALKKINFAKPEVDCYIRKNQCYPIKSNNSLF